MGNIGKIDAMGYGQMFGAAFGAFNTFMDVRNMKRQTDASISAMRERNTQVFKEQANQMQNVMANIGIQQMNTTIALQSIRGQQNTVMASTNAELSAAGMVGSSFDAMRSNLTRAGEEQAAREMQNYLTTAMNLKDQGKQLLNSGMNSISHTAQVGQMAQTDIGATASAFGTMGKLLSGFAGGGSASPAGAAQGLRAGDGIFGGFGGQPISGQAGMFSSWLGAGSYTSKPTNHTFGIERMTSLGFSNILGV